MITTETIRQQLSVKYFDNTKAMLAFEVSGGTGSASTDTASTRRVDAVSFEFRPANGYKIIGYEFKLYRRDWLKELQQPDKSQAVSRFCDYWYLVTPENVLAIDELPDKWGWMLVNSKGLKIKIRAPKRKAEPMDKPFAASLLRKCVEKNSNNELITQAYFKGKAESKRDVTKNVEGKISSLEKIIKQHENIFTNFKSKTGLSLSGWNYGGTAEAIKALKQFEKRKDIINNLQHWINAQKVLIKNNEKALEAIANWPGGK